MGEQLSDKTVKAIDEIVKDNKILSLKSKVMDKMKNYSMLNSISESCKFVAGPLMFAGIGGITSGLTTTAAWAATAITSGVVVLGAALALLGAGIATGYAASRVSQGGSFDNLEINAMSTARHLVQELEEKNLCLAPVEYPHNCRKDGKAWVKVVNRPGHAQASSPQPNMQT